MVVHWLKLLPHCKEATDMPPDLFVKSLQVVPVQVAKFPPTSKNLFGYLITLNCL